MSAVDVRAVQYLKELSGDYAARRLVGTANDIDACAAAIAELIEADRELQFIRQNGCAADTYDAATARHDAALANVQGDKA